MDITVIKVKHRKIERMIPLVGEEENLVHEYKNSSPPRSRKITNTLMRRALRGEKLSKFKKLLFLATYKPGDVTLEEWNGKGYFSGGNWKIIRPPRIK